MFQRRFLGTLGLALLLMAPFAARAQAERGAQADLRWMGALQDKADRGKQVKPDGRKDGHFRLTLRSERFRKIVHVLLRSCDQRGVLTGRAAWDTDQKRLWAVGVFKAGRKLPLGRGKVIDRLKGRVRYDLYAAQPVGGFKPGEHYCAYVTFDDGMGVYARARVQAPVRGTLRWKGTDRDKVGRGKRDRPDGVPDGHFLLNVDAGKRRVKLVSLTLQRIDKSGKPSRTERWDTHRNRIWVLGVERKGRRLNRGDRPLRDDLRGKASYHLYAARRGQFRDGARYRVVARFAGGGPAVAVATVKKQAPASAKLAYVGLEADKVGAKSPSGPDGKNDGHFRLTIQAPTPRKVSAVVLRAVWPGGAAVKGQVWDTRPRGYRMIALYRGGKLLNRGDKGFEVRVQGTQRYDLYVHNTGWIRPLQNFQAEVVFQGGDRIFAKTKVLKRKPRGPVKLALQYHGFVADKVGTGTRARPDGKRDAKLTLRVDTGGRQLTIEKIELSVSDAKGNTWRKSWDTQPGGPWILGVVRGGKRLNPKDRPLKQIIQGKVSYTLWAANDHWKDAAGRKRTYFSKGGYFTARVYAKGRAVVITTIRLR